MKTRVFLNQYEVLKAIGGYAVFNNPQLKGKMIHVYLEMIESDGETYVHANVEGTESILVDSEPEEKTQ